MRAWGSSDRKRSIVFDLVANTLNALVVSFFLLTVCGAVWEYSTREYLNGFADGVVPLKASPEQKVQAILGWMDRGPARKPGGPDGDEASRDPEDTLNYRSLLQVCGGAVNGFVNLADASGLEARRVLLLTPALATSHVVAEVRLDGRWVVVDPVYRAILRDASGRTLTLKELADPATFRQATGKIAKYNPEYKYDFTTHIRFSALPFIGRTAQEKLDAVMTNWVNFLNWTLVFERRSYAVLISGFGLLLLFLPLKLEVDRWGAKRYPCPPLPLWDLTKRGGLSLFGFSVKTWGQEPKTKRI